MLADFDIPTVSNDRKIAVQKNNLVGQILYRSFVPSKKNGVNISSGTSPMAIFIKSICAYWKIKVARCLYRRIVVKTACYSSNLN